jgi:hypothetical protein
MANTIFTLSDLEIINTHEARVVDTVVAERLGYDRPRKVRELIERNTAELLTFGNLPHRGANSGQRGRPAEEYLLNEGQALVVCALSRTPKAAEVRKQIIDVFMAWRAGELPTIAPRPGRPTNRDDEICALYASGQWRQIDLAAKFGMTQAAISRVVRKAKLTRPAKGNHGAWLEAEDHLLQLRVALMDAAQQYEAFERLFYREAFGYEA